MTESNDNLLKNIETLKSNHKYTTVFVFMEINKRIAEEELSEFNKSSLLFLNNILNVQFDLANMRRTISIEKSSTNNQTTIKIKEDSNIDEWEVLCSQNDQRDRVALKRANDSIIPAIPQESVIHSFTPTIEFAGAYLKIMKSYAILTLPI